MVFLGARKPSTADSRPVPDASFGHLAQGSGQNGEKWEGHTFWVNTAGLGSRRAIHQRIALDEQGETCPEHAADVGDTLAAKAK